MNWVTRKISDGRMTMENMKGPNLSCAVHLHPHPKLNILVSQMLFI